MSRGIGSKEGHGVRGGSSVCASSGARRLVASASRKATYWHRSEQQHFPSLLHSARRASTCADRWLALGSQTARPPRTTMPRRYSVDPNKGVLNVEWPLFGELSRALALKVARAYDPEIVVGIATAGVVPGAVIAAILDREFHSITVSRRFHAPTVRETPAVF